MMNTFPRIFIDKSKGTKEMTYDEFLLALRTVSSKYTCLGQNGAPLRFRGTGKGEYYCPITLVAATTDAGYRYYDVARWKVAAENLGLRLHIAEQIYRAADLEENYDKQIRADLEQAISNDGVNL